MATTAPEKEPHPHARAAIGRALGHFGLDRHKGVGLRADGLPDIDWVRIPGDAPFTYQDGVALRLATFHIARYPITHAQFQAFVDAGGYREDLWWQDLSERFDAPASAGWDEPNAPRERVSWYEAVAFCRWLGERLRYPITLPTEQQWERAARGTRGFDYPWGEGYRGVCEHRRAVGAYRTLRGWSDHGGGDLPARGVARGGFGPERQCLGVVPERVRRPRKHPVVRR